MQSKGQEENACRNDDNKWIKKKNPTTNKKASHHSQPNTNKQNKKPAQLENH